MWGKRLGTQKVEEYSGGSTAEGPSPGTVAAV